MFFNYSNGNSFLNFIQQLFNIRVYRLKNKKKLLNDSKVEEKNLFSIYQKSFSSINKESFEKILSGKILIKKLFINNFFLDFKITPRRLLKQKKFEILFGSGQSILIFPSTSTIGLY